ncbi:MAG: dTDP-glucose 4,6-dehydratase [Syntrophobacterales bacterium]|nr:dTDP-glucose 4,6-dehydratase [Syntrophobacterales bacterium]
MTTVLVTGGAGFIGANFLHFLRRERPRWHLINFDLLTYAGNPENLADLAGDPHYTFIRGDVADWEAVTRVFSRHDIDLVVHFAAETHVDRSILDPAVFVRTNVVGTGHLLEAARRTWGPEARARGRRFLQISTDEVFGSLGSHDPPVRETAPYAPSSPYSASKAGADWLARAYGRTYGLPVLLTHCSNNYGPYQFPEKLIPFALCQALEGKPVPIYGTGGNIRDWIYVEDHCRGLLAVLEGGEPGESYNLGGEQEISNLELVRLLLAELVAQRPDLGPRDHLITFVPDRPGHDWRYALDLTKVRTTLGWQPQVSLKEGLRRTVAWYLSHPGWLERVRTGEYRHFLQRQYGGVAG